MITKGESGEHKKAREDLAAWFRRKGWSNVKSPADEVPGGRPDVQGDAQGGRVYGEAKLLEDFSEADTRDQLARYDRDLPTEYQLVLGVPRAAESAARRALEAWGLTGRVLLVAL
jgi:hypothetical protein